MLAELPKGGSSFVNFSLGAKFDAYGSVQWDGDHLTLTNPSHHEIYRVKFSHSSVRVVGTTRLRSWHNSYYGHWPYVQTWLIGYVYRASEHAGESRLMALSARRRPRQDHRSLQEWRYQHIRGHG